MRILKWTIAAIIALGGSAAAHTPPECVPLFHEAAQANESFVRKGQDTTQASYDVLDRKEPADHLVDQVSQLLGHYATFGTKLTAAIQCLDGHASAGASEPVIPDPCNREALSAEAKETIRLYSELHGFKDDPEFLAVGFGRGGPYHQWMQAIESVRDRAGIKVLRDLGFVAGDVLMLGMDYMGGAPLPDHVETMENRIREGISEAGC